jgi:hypothetical protein
VHGFVAVLPPRGPTLCRRGATGNRIHTRSGALIFNQGKT